MGNGDEIDLLRKLVVDTYKSDFQRTRYLSYINGLVSKGLPPILSFSHLADILLVQKDRLRDMVFRSEFHYSKFFIPKRAGGKREIAAPFAELDAIQRWILTEVLKSAPELKISNVVGYVRGKSTLDHVTPHLGAICLIKYDLKDFFPTIKVRHVTKIFSDLGYSIKVSRVLAGLVTMNGHLPQGASTSPQLSNIFMQNFDNDLVSLCDERGFAFTRYADDIVISGGEILFREIDPILEVFYKHNLVLNSSKTRFYKKPHDVRFITGLMIQDGKVRLPKAMRRKIRSEVFALLQELQNFVDGNINWKSQTGLVQDPVFIDRTIGKLNYWKFVDPNDPYPILMREKLEELLKRFE